MQVIVDILPHDKQINPDVIGHIFEKYINQKQMAYCDIELQGGIKKWNSRFLNIMMKIINL